MKNLIFLADNNFSGIFRTANLSNLKLQSSVLSNWVIMKGLHVFLMYDHRQAKINRLLLDLAHLPALLH